MPPALPAQAPSGALRESHLSPDIVSLVRPCTPYLLRPLTRVAQLQEAGYSTAEFFSLPEVRRR